MRQIALLAKAYVPGGCCVAGIDVGDGRLRRILRAEGGEIPREQLFSARGTPMRLGDVIAVEECESVDVPAHMTEALVCRSEVKWELVRHLPARDLFKLCRPRRHKYLFYNKNTLVSQEELAQIPAEYYYSLMLAPAEQAALHIEEGDVRLSLTYNAIPYAGIRVANSELIDYAMTHYDLFDMESVDLNEKSLLLLAMSETPDEAGYYEKQLVGVLNP